MFDVDVNDCNSCLYRTQETSFCLDHNTSCEVLIESLSQRIHYKFLLW